MPVYGKLDGSGNLTDLSNEAAPRTWADGSTDVLLVAFPTFAGPYGYDAVNKVAIFVQADLTADQRATAVADATDPSPEFKLQRAAIVSIMTNVAQEFNVVIAAHNTVTAALTHLLNAITAQGATLASIQTAAKTIAMPLPTPATITASAAINAVKSDLANHINSGAAD